MQEQNRVISRAKGWAVTSDGVQWMLARDYIVRGRQYYAPVAFVRSERDVLVRCMVERGLRPSIIKSLTKTLPETFDIWNQSANPLPETAAGAAVPDGDIKMPAPDKRTTRPRKRQPLRRR